jgi:Arc/MetJ-type ribon-helix-helix transcriptional regulator
VGDDELTKSRRHTTVSIPITLYNKIKEFIQETGFTSVSDYVTYVLREVVTMHETSKRSEPFSDEDRERIKQRLKALGYIS